MTRNDMACLLIDLMMLCLIMAEVDKLIVGNWCELYKISSTNNLRFFWLPISVLNFTIFLKK